MQRLHLNVVGLSEVRWPGVICVETSKGGSSIYSIGQTAERSVGMMIEKSLKPSLIGYWAASDRVLLVHIKGKPFTTCIIQVYAPTSDHDKVKLDQFYQKLNRARGQCNEHLGIMVTGDPNAKVGHGRTKDIVGPYRLGRRNDRGDKFVDWCLEKKQVITNTWFKHHPRHLWTLKSPRDRARNQVDFITINKRYRNAVK